MLWAQPGAPIGCAGLGPPRAHNCATSGWFRRSKARSLVISWWSRTGPPPRLCRPSVSSSLVWAQIVGELEPRLDEFAERPATGSSRGGDCRSALGTLVRKQGVGVVHERNVVGL